MADSPAIQKARGDLSFVVHGIVALAALAFLNVLMARWTPVAIDTIESSYWIFFYHFPAAINCYLFFTVVMIMSILYLRSQDPVWDRYARVAAEVGVLALTVTLLTGSTWARMAWNQWWIWNDPRLMSAAIMWLVYIGYIFVQYSVEDPQARRRVAAVLGILAFVNIPVVHYAIQLSKEVSHPQKFNDLSSDGSIIWTRWYGVLAFLLLYSLIYRWKLARERTREELEQTLSTVRRMEEGALE